MQYRHGFHAGNFADVHKHIALLQLVQAFKRKAKGFQYLDTHAGEGLYDLHGEQARHGQEAQAGIGRLVRQLAGSAGRSHAAIHHFTTVLERIQAAQGIPSRAYAGSPLLVAVELREADQAICVEAQPQAARALQRAFERSASLLASKPHVVSGDGYHEVSSRLPPTQRRGLTLIDPPYESGDDEQQIATALAAGLERFETGVFAVWYPIKKQHDTDLWLARVLRGVERPTLAAEMCLATPDHAAGLNGSGMLVVNPPWKFAEEAGRWQAELHHLLGGHAGATVKWLVHEQ